MEDLVSALARRIVTLENKLEDAAKLLEHHTKMDHCDIHHVLAGVSCGNYEPLEERVTVDMLHKRMVERRKGLSYKCPPPPFENYLNDSTR